MRRTGFALGLVTAGCFLAIAVAQDYDPERRSPRRGSMPPAGFWPTERMIELAIDRITEKMAETYGFDEDQLWNTRDLLKSRFPQWMQDNRAELQALTNQWIETVMAGEPPTPEEVADWSNRALPLFEEFTGLVDETIEDMRTYLTPEQEVLLDGQKAFFQVGLNYMRDRLNTWKAGGYDWRTEWPRSEEFRRQEHVRQQRLQQEAENARLAAMGIAPAAGNSAPDAAPAGRNPPAERKLFLPKPGETDKAQDEWAVYVENFIKRYRLDEAQQNAARRFLRDQQELRDRYLRRKLPEIESLEQRQKAAQTDEERAKVRAEVEQLNRPIERYFQRLKDRLETLPTRKQRAAAAESDKAAPPATGPSEKTKAAMKQQMEARLGAGKSESAQGQKEPTSQQDAPE